MMDTVPRSSETEAVYLDLTRRMESGELPIGTRLPGEDVLATRYGASRGAIRRALQYLADAGLTETRAGRGTFVVSADYSVDPVLGRYSVTDLAEARPHIEVPAAGLAALRRTPEQVVELDRLVEEMDNESDSDKWVQLDAAFHGAIAEASGNGVFLAIAEEIRDAMIKQAALLRSLAQQPRTLNAEHRAILEAIAGGAERAASNAMAAHLRSVGGAVQTLFPGPES